MKNLFLFFSILGICTCYAQKSNKKDIQNNEKLPYHEYRIENSIPPYSLSKIKNKISKLELVSNDDEKISYTGMSENDFSKLSEKEKFTYIMIHPENKSQISSDVIPISDEDKKIFGYLPHDRENRKWSEKQQKFLKSEKTLVMSLIKENALKDMHIGLNYKIALEEINAIEMIPFLIDFYNDKDKKDKDILTLLLTLTKKNKYHPFTRSNIFNDLYSNENSSDHNYSYIDYTELNEEYVLKTAANFYAQSPKIK